MPTVARGASLGSARDRADPVVHLASAVAALLLEAIVGGGHAARSTIAHDAIHCSDLGPAELPGGPGWPDEPLTQGETRVLRYLPTHMSSREIADQLYVSTNTVKTHLRHLYQKLGAHSRHEAVDHARTAGLLAVPPPAPHTDRRYEVAYGHAERNLALIRQLEAETRRLLASVDQSDAERSAWMQQDAAALPPPRMPAKRNHR